MGFSLLELMIVLGILATVTIGVSYFVQSLSRTRAVSVRDRLVFFISKYKRLAFDQKVNFHFDYNATTDNFCVRCVGTDTECINEYGSGEIFCLQLEKPIQMNFGGGMNVTSRGFFTSSGSITVALKEGQFSADNLPCISVSVMRLVKGFTSNSTCNVQI